LFSLRPCGCAGVVGEAEISGCCRSHERLWTREMRCCVAQAFHKMGRYVYARHSETPTRRVRCVPRPSNQVAKQTRLAVAVRPRLKLGRQKTLQQGCHE
jgi:hypothetical protein